MTAMISSMVTPTRVDDGAPLSGDREQNGFHSDARLPSRIGAELRGERLVSYGRTTAIIREIEANR